MQYIQCWCPINCAPNRNCASLNSASVAVVHKRKSFIYKHYTWYFRDVSMMDSYGNCGACKSSTKDTHWIMAFVYPSDAQGVGKFPTELLVVQPEEISMNLRIRYGLGPVLIAETFKPLWFVSKTTSHLAIQFWDCFSSTDIIFSPAGLRFYVR